MTLAMAIAKAIPMDDSVVPANLPACAHYLVYVDGLWQTAGPVRKAHPDAVLLTMTVLGGHAVADGCDCEAGDLTPAQAAAWVRQRLAAGEWRPVVYESASAMQNVLDELARLGITRGQVRLLSAHYGAGEHICGPDVPGCGYPAADGTQWTETAPGADGTRIDQSILDDDFFGPAKPVPVTTQEADVQLPVIRQGDSGQPVRNLQGLLIAHGYGYLIAPVPGSSVEDKSGVDGAYGAKTADAVTRFQEAKTLPATGIADGKTWAALLG